MEIEMRNNQDHHKNGNHLSKSCPSRDNSKDSVVSEEFSVEERVGREETEPYHYETKGERDDDGDYGTTTDSKTCSSHDAVPNTNMKIIKHCATEIAILASSSPEIKALKLLDYSHNSTPSTCCSSNFTPTPTSLPGNDTTITDADGISVYETNGYGAQAEEEKEEEQKLFPSGMANNSDDFVNSLSYSFEDICIIDLDDTIYDNNNKENIPPGGIPKGGDVGVNCQPISIPKNANNENIYKKKMVPPKPYALRRKALSDRTNCRSIPGNDNGNKIDEYSLKKNKQQQLQPTRGSMSRLKPGSNKQPSFGPSPDLRRPSLHRRASFASLPSPFDILPEDDVFDVNKVRDVSEEVCGSSKNLPHMPLLLKGQDLTENAPPSSKSSCRPSLLSQSYCSLSTSALLQKPASTRTSSRSHRRNTGSFIVPSKSTSMKLSTGFR